MATRPIYGTGENYGEIVGYEEIPDSQTSIAKQINVTPQLFQPMSDNYALPTDIAQKSTINGNLVNSFYDPQSGNLTGYSVDVGDMRVTYGPDGQVRNAQPLKGDFLKDVTTELGPMALMALTMGGAGGLIGGAVNNALGMSLSTAAQSALGGALLGGGGAALTGGDVLKGAVLGGAGGYAGNVLGGSGDYNFNGPTADMPSMADLTGTSTLTGFEQYVGIPTDLGSLGGDVGALDDVQFDYPELDMPEVPQALEAPQAPAPQEVKFDFPELDMPEVPQAPELPEIAAPQEVKFDYPELDMPEPEVPAEPTPEPTGPFPEEVNTTLEDLNLTPAPEPVVDATEFNHEPISAPDTSLNDLQKLVLTNTIVPPIVKMVTTPEMPQPTTGFTYESDNKPNYDIKFDNPVHWADIKVPEFKLSDTVTSPYFTQSKTGQAQGPMLNAGSDA